jgi:UDP-N-acetylmuramoyl-tripeptide--D-alanyl-D-alanine ligase
MVRIINHEKRRELLKKRRNFKTSVIGVTGNVGKTTTIAMISTVLEQHGKVIKNSKGQGNFNTNVALLEQLSPDASAAIFEFDFFRNQSFAEILDIIKPNIGIVTNIGDAHLSYIGGMVDVALQRSEVVKYLARDGTAILNKDDELSSALSEHIETKNIIKFGLSKTADYYATNIEHLGPLGTKFILNDKYHITIPIYSISDVYNFLAATATLVSLNFPIETIIETFQQKYQLPNGRGKLHKLNGYYVLDESYDATPRSVAKAARSLVGFRPYSDRLIFIIGDMTESGPNVEERHLNMGYFLSALPINCFITVGPYAEYIGRGISLIQQKGKMVVTCNTINEILSTLDEILTGKAVIVVQGVGQVALRRVLNYLEKKEKNA